MTERVIPETVIAKQHAASDPAASAWVSANAGAGKTHVLAQRVIRLLLDGTDPAKILCLTFTKAAAANMANRIFGALGEWIALDDRELDKAIRDIGAKPGGARQRARARQLFAAALETPGGLKVQTIHAFCTRLLQQFPFEANVAARFAVMEEAEQKSLLEDIRREVLLEAAAEPDSAVGRALATLVPLVSDFTFEDALRQAILARGDIEEWFESTGGPEAARAQLSAALGIAGADTLESIEREILEGPHLPSSEWPSVAAICATGSTNDQNQGARLTEAATGRGRSRLEAYASIFFTDKGTPRATVLTGALARKHPDLAARFKSEAARAATLCERWRAAMIRDRTMALFSIAHEVTVRYAAEKDRRGLLDYDDLIARTRDLLDRVEAAWVHYKLDLGIDHLLIDEAQDTSPAQWDIIKRFVAEFTSGAGARGTVRRSIFAVGDDKQSIFSFQGAEPKAFAEMRQFFDTAHRETGRPFEPIVFQYSFRSAPAVLEAVDDVFRQPAAHEGLAADPVPTVHQAVRAAAPGVVELWPLVEPDEKEEVEPWDAPFDTTTESNPRVKLARRIAKTVKTWIRRRIPVGDDRHALRPGDVLILVRQRGPLFEAIIRTLKQEGIEVAGADRLILTDHIAVMDLLAFADALLLPDDELALATILKSPLIGLTEDELYALAADRQGPLRDALRIKRPEIAAQLDALRAQARHQSPFAFYADLLGPGGGRRAFFARLGPEAGDALDEFLNHALAYERGHTPSLQGFAAWLRSAAAEVKRDMEIARDEVRVMTVHGAKGLEAPLVILADTTTPPTGPPQYQPRLLPLPSPAANAPPPIAWMPKNEDDIPVIVAARDAMLNAVTKEHRRLLYVAMTRAADRLVVCGSIGVQKMTEGCWYDLVQRGLESSGRLVEEPADVDGGTVRRYRKDALEVPAPAVPIATELPLTDAPPRWLTVPVAADPIRAAAIKPSGTLGGAPMTEAQAAARRAALARGVIVHRLMQSLPDIPLERRPDAMRRFLARQRLDAAERDAITRQVTAVLDDRRFAPLFAPSSRAEVPMVGRLNGRDVPSGVVDRLAVTDTDVLIADYKTNRPAPRRPEDVPPEYIRQLAIYRGLLSKLYPGRPVRAVLLWTDVPDLMEIPADALNRAIESLTSA